LLSLFARVMGCKVSHGVPTASTQGACPACRDGDDLEAAAPVEVGLDGAEVGTWATKTAIAEAGGSAKQSDGISAVGDDSSSYANGQEAPYAVETSHSAPSPRRPLPKVQLAEAAKLAEKRRSFDNERYRNQGSPHRQPGHPDVVATEGTSLTPSEHAVRSPLTPDDDTRVPSAISSRSASPERCIRANASAHPLAPSILPRKDGAGKLAFDGSEEALMTEILEDVDVA